MYQEVPDAPPQVIVVTPGYGRYARQRVAPAPAPEAKPRPRWTSEFGLNLRVEGVAVGHGNGYGSTAGMGGVGLSLRYRPVPHFAFDLGVDVLAGNDYNGFQRVEVPVTLNGMIFLNPRSRVQVYLLGGMNVSRASVHSPFAAPQLSMSRDGMDYSNAYTYLGGQGGGGLEFRLSKHVALDLDVVGFVRKRIDDGADRGPAEFIDPNSGRTTNTSGGALFRGGLTFWW
jgi:opacity protein-like surface antigen